MIVTRQFIKHFIFTAIFIVGVTITPQITSAHCDSMGGPVVSDARKSLDTGDLNHVLIWVTEDQEAEVRDVFQQTLGVRQESEQARKLADRYFFETVVRLHRASEGAHYTGLKPAGSSIAPFVPKADKAIQSGSLEEVQKLLHKTIEDGLKAYFHPALEARDFDPEDVEAGREFVHRYVEFLHYIKPVFEAAATETGAESHAASHAH